MPKDTPDKTFPQVTHPAGANYRGAPSRTPHGVRPSIDGFEESMTPSRFACHEAGHVIAAIAELPLCEVELCTIDTINCDQVDDADAGEYAGVTRLRLYASNPLRGIRPDNCDAEQLRPWLLHSVAGDASEAVFGYRSLKRRPANRPGDPDTEELERAVEWLCLGKTAGIKFKRDVWRRAICMIEVRSAPAMAVACALDEHGTLDWHDLREILAPYDLH